MKTHLILFIAFYAASSLANICTNFYSEQSVKKVVIDTNSVKLTRNKETRTLFGKILARSSSETLDIPTVVAIWKNLIQQEAFSGVTENSTVFIYFSGKPESTVVQFDEQNNTFQIRLSSSKDLSWASNKKSFTLIKANNISANETLALKKPLDHSIFTSGLVSISAEPPEAFFAASTKAEMAEMGFKNTSSTDAKIWIVRTADSRTESVFKFSYATEDRPTNIPYNDKFLVAVGLGPKNNPASTGLKEADLIISGDEQKGILASMLQTLRAPILKISDLDQFSGTAVKTNPNEVFLNSLQYSWYLSKSGFSDLKTDPEIFRKIISTEYDEFLSTLFKDGKAGRNKVSYLLATSRGCTQGCAICCSGGLSPFQYFSSTRIIEELQKIKQLHSNEKQIDVFFVDSNFNNNPDRIIELAAKIKEAQLESSFRYFVRHNTLNGFLNPAKEAAIKTPNIELIEAYKTLGIKEIMMGIDSYDNASVVTLKSNRVLLPKKGVQLRPTYSYEETALAISEMTKRGLYTRGFLLTNNPFVSDLDRIDSYYNLFFLWSKTRKFSIDARSREIIQLKPFPGSPVGDAAIKYPSLVRNGRFHTISKLGELDEHMDFLVFNKSAEEIGIEKGLQALLAQRAHIRNQALSSLHKDKNDIFMLAILNKLKQRDFELLSYLVSVGGSSTIKTHSIEQEMQATPVFVGDLYKYQELMFEKMMTPLLDSLSSE